MKISEIPYERVSKEQMEGAYADFLEKTKVASSAEGVISARAELMETHKRYSTAYALAESRFLANTTDEFYKAEVDYYNEVNPIISGLSNRYYAAMLASPFRKQLEERLGGMLFRSFEVALKAHSDECIADEQEENALTTEYSALMSGMLFEWEGEQVPLATLRGKLEEGDAAVRRRAADAIGRGLEAHSEQLDGIFDKLVAVRTRIARKMGYKNFVELGYYRMGRLDYDEKMVNAFRKNVCESIVPVVSRLKEKIRADLGLKILSFADNEVYARAGNPTFTLSPDEAFAAARDTYAKMDGELGEFFAEMVDSEAFDVLSREGKWGGGFCIDYPQYEKQFILANFNGTTADADVLTHEFGHAYAMHACVKSGVDYELGIGGMETAECHSMSMEFLSYPFMEAFFGAQADLYRYKHLADALSFIPYGCIVDEFQHIVYENPDMTPDERNQAYANLEKKYRPYLSFEGLSYLEKGTRWQYQMHIYENPFYYIDYCLAQTVALGFLVKSQENYPLALEKYKQFCKSGGSLPFSRLVKNAEIAYPFGEGTLQSLAEQIQLMLNL